MSELHLMNQRYFKYIIYLLAIYVLGWGFTEYRDVFLGLITGTVCSLFNLWTMIRGQKRFSNAVEYGGKTGSLGMLSRMAAAGLGVLISLRYPEEVSLVATAIGIVTIHIVIMIDFLIQTLRNKLEER
ncbi:ATP synthase subunit [Bacillus mangrovi]|uniref:ATP synthase subunit n=1 Tax=Metabacillus mangrovi TaxID=1491830 RepID=A0A7X2S5R8_9BACI|nr:ATP synthase subunit I [Metabacillus mangrovi]MTH54020.1 ATP synthase subunit [Metabacillus mangrovi]